MSRALAVAACCFVGCGLFPDLSFLEGPRDGSDDASSDADTGASDAGQNDDSGANLVPNSTFDTDCSDWTVFQATLTPDPDAHTGARSCRVCRETGNLYSIDEVDGVLPVPKVNQSWHAHGWVKLPSGGRAHAAAIYLRTWDAADMKQLDIVSGGDVTLSTSWQPLDVDFTDTMANAAILDVFVSASNAQAGDCFLVDDVTVVRTN